MLADKFDVSACIVDCADTLQEDLSTIEDASLFLNLPEALQQQPALREFVESSRKALGKLLQNLDQLFISET